MVSFSNVRRHLGRATAAALLLLAASATVALAAATTPDATFDGDGIVQPALTDFIVYYDLQLQADGKLLLVGDHGGAPSNLLVERRNEDGSRDATFSGGDGTDGFLAIDVNGSYDHVFDVMVDAAGRIVITGNANIAGQTDVIMGRLLGDGSPDPSFGKNGRLRIGPGVDSRLTGQDYGYSLSQDSLGRYVLAGKARNASEGTDDFLLARIRPNGTFDTTIQGRGTALTSIVAGMNEGAYAAAAWDDPTTGARRMVLAGNSQRNLDPTGAIVRYEEDSTLDTGFAAGGRFIVADQGGVPGRQAKHLDLSFFKALHVNADGSMLVAGWIGTGTDQDILVARITAAGAWDSCFGTGGAAIVDVAGGRDDAESLIVQADGSIIVAGMGTDAGGIAHPVLVRLLASGTLDPTFDGDGVYVDARGTSTNSNDGSTYEGVGLMADGRIVVAGKFQDGDEGALKHAFAQRLQGSAPVASTCGGQVSTPTPPAPEVDPDPSVVVVGDDRNDQVSGATGHDLLRGGRGNDRLYGRGGNDRMWGGAGHDRLFGGTGTDQLRGGPGNDLLVAGPGLDRSWGDAGNDRIICSSGRDFVWGGAGNDFVNCRDRRGGDVVRCGPGRDVALVDRGDRVFGCERVRRA